MLVNKGHENVTFWRRVEKEFGVTFTKEKICKIFGVYLGVFFRLSGWVAGVFDSIRVNPNMVHRHIIVKFK